MAGGISTQAARNVHAEVVSKGGKAQIWQHVLAKFDADGDGTLNVQERKAAWQAFQKRIQDRAAK